MSAELHVSASAVFSFLMVLVRMAGAFVFVPLPNTEAGPSLVRVVMALACTLALFPAWPANVTLPSGLAQMVLWLFSEVALGVSIGVAVAFVAEALVLGAQMLSVQAGYSYASMIDPVSQSDSAVLSVIAQLTAGLLFFAAGLDRQVIQAFALSLDKNPPGSYIITPSFATALIRLGGSVFTVGLRLAFPIIGLLLMTDLALALLGRINSQLHLVMLAHPAKMLLGLAALSSILLVFPSIYESLAGQAFSLVHTAIGH